MAGLKPGDVVIDIDSKPQTDDGALMDNNNSLKVGQTIQVTYSAATRRAQQPSR